jgi:hypothetical protein
LAQQLSPSAIAGVSKQRFSRNRLEQVRLLDCFYVAAETRLSRGGHVGRGAENWIAKNAIAEMSLPKHRSASLAMTSDRSKID